MSNNPFLDYQQEFFKTWNENVNKIPGMEAYTKMFQNMPNPQEFWKNLVPTSMPDPMEFWKMFQFNEWWKNLQNFQMADFWKNFQIPESLSKYFQIPEAWKNFQMPDMSKYWQIPEAWKNFQMPDMSKYWQIPEAWKNFQMPDMSKYWQIPEAWKNFQMPDMSKYWQIPEAWKNFQMPDMSKYFQIPEAWKNFQMPDMSKYFQIPDAWKDFQSAEFWKNFQPADLWKNVQQPMDYWKNIQSMMPNVEKYWKDFEGMFPNVGNFSTMFPYKIPGMELYGKIFDLWRGISDPATFAKDFQEKYMDLMQDMFANVMPNGDKSILAKPMELMDTCVNYYKQTMGPWMQLDQDVLNRIANGDQNAYLDFFKQFNEKYDETVGKYFSVMGLGLNRESNEEQMQAVNAYFKSMFAGGEVAATVMNTLGGSMKDLVEAYQKGLADGKSFSTYREFYDLWYKTTEDALIKLFSTDEFAKTFDNYAEKYANYMSAMNKVYERALSNLPIPTNSDMKSLYKTVYDLRKDMRDLKRSVNGLSVAAETKKEG